MQTAEVAGQGLLKVVSFNLKRDGLRPKRHSWEARREMAANLIRESGAAIIGVQELLPTMRQDLEERLDDYQVMGCGRYLGKFSFQDEHSDIIVKNDAADVDFYKTFWLSNQSYRPGSRGLLAMFPRVCTMAEMYVEPLGTKVRVFNTHLDCLSAFARNLGARIILEYMHRYNRREKLPTILMGDMNATPDSKAIRTFSENKHPYKNIRLKMVYEALQDKEQIQNTYHGFKGKVVKGSQPIDYIFVSDELEVVDTRILEVNEDGRYPSDHFPVMATLRLKK